MHPTPTDAPVQADTSAQTGAPAQTEALPQTETLPQTDASPRPALGAAGEPCRECGSPLATDQLYCLECGRRRDGAVLPFVEPLATRGVAGGSSGTPLPPSRPRAERSANTTAVAGVGCLLLAMGVGVLIGRSAGHSTTSQVAATPQVISIASGAPGATTAGAAAFADDWPAGKTGYTVQLQSLPVSSTQPSAVAAAKTAAGAKGAPGVGALQSDNYTGLPAGQYIVYSGVYPNKRQADKALATLKAKFPGATVVAITPASGASTSTAAGGASGASAPAASQSKPSAVIQQLNNATGQQYEKQQKKLPPVISTGGKPPPKDNKPAGAGGSFQTIG